MKRSLVLMVGAALVLGGWFSLADKAQARPQYKMEFDKKYMKDGTPLFKALAGKSNCNVCHQGTKSKKNRNDLGKALAKVVDMNEKDPAKIQKALEEAVKTESKKGGPTFAQLIEKGELPITMEEP